MVVDTLTITFGALADPTRRSLVRRLAGGPASVGELARPFRISQQAVSKHLACLERAGLVEKRQAGRLRFCALRAARFREAADWVAPYRRCWEESFGRLEEHLQGMKSAVHKPEKKYGHES